MIYYTDLFNFIHACAAVLQTCSCIIDHDYPVPCTITNNYCYSSIQLSLQNNQSYLSFSNLPDIKGRGYKCYYYSKDIYAQGIHA